MDSTCIRVDDPGPAKKFLEYEVNWLQKISVMKIQNVSGKMNEQIFYKLQCESYGSLYIMQLSIATHKI